MMEYAPKTQLKQNLELEYQQPTEECAGYFKECEQNDITTKEKCKNYLAMKYHPDRGGNPEDFIKARECMN